MFRKRGHRGTHAVGQLGQGGLDAGGADRLVLGEGHRNMRVGGDLACFPLLDGDHALAGNPRVVLHGGHQGAEREAEACRAAQRIFQSVRDRRVVEPAPGASGLEVRAFAHGSGQPQRAGAHPGRGFGQHPIRHHLGGINHKHVAVVRPVVDLGLGAVKMLPPELLALAAVVPRGRGHHGDGTFVVGPGPVVREPGQVFLQAELLRGWLWFRKRRRGRNSGRRRCRPPAVVGRSARL